MPTFFTRDQFITFVPVEERGGRLYALGVPVWLHSPCRIPDDLSWRIEDALNVEAVAKGVNMPVALDPHVWLHRCRCCRKPFIALPNAKLCSDACRALAKRDSWLRASAKRAERRNEASKARTSACRHCGERVPASRSSKRFCSVRCRVAAHRGSPATFTVEWPDTGETPEIAWIEWGAATVAALDRRIVEAQQTLAALKMVGTGDPATAMRHMMGRIIAMQAERAKIKA